MGQNKGTTTTAGKLLDIARAATLVGQEGPPVADIARKVEVTPTTTGNETGQQTRPVDQSNAKPES